MEHDSPLEAFAIIEIHFLLPKPASLGELKGDWKGHVLLADISVVQMW